MTTYDFLIGFFLTINDTSVLTRFDKDLNDMQILWDTRPETVGIEVPFNKANDWTWESEESTTGKLLLSFQGYRAWWWWSALVSWWTDSAGIDKPAAVSYCPLIVRSTPWLLITIQKRLNFFFWSHFSSFQIVQRHFSVSFYSFWWNFAYDFSWQSILHFSLFVTRAF